MYNDAGVTINGYKQSIGLNTTEEDAAFTFNVAKALGATHVTMELPTDPAVSKRAGELAEKNRFYIGYHNHTGVNFNSWDAALSQSKYNGMNFDVGHYFGGTGESPIPLMQKYHDRIMSLHLKDKKSLKNGGQNMPWGQGETPLKEVLLLMRKQKWNFPANIELEYPTPEGSTSLIEIGKCVKYAKDALA